MQNTAGWLVVFLFAAALSACSPAKVSLTPAETLPSPIETQSPVPPTPVPPVAASRTPRSTGSPTQSPPTQIPTPAKTQASSFQAPFPLALPIPQSGSIPLDLSYRFASTQDGAREPHHGVEFLNPFGSPVLAAADGRVLFAGDDNNGGPYTPPGWYAFYGNFVLLQHDLPGLELPVYTLYAHLSEIGLATGQTVQAGQEVGKIGFSGAAIGPHLHFEVRYGGITYADSRNPELWLQPEEGHGTLAGHIQDSSGYPIAVLPLTITPLDRPGSPVYLTTYQDPTLAEQPPFGENFTFWDLPAGRYQLTFVLYGLQEITFEILPGQLTDLQITAGDEN